MIQLSIFAGRILLYGPLNLKVSFPVRPINLRYNKYLTNLVFSIRTVSYGSSFFPVDLWPARFVLGPQANGKKLGP